MELKCVDGGRNNASAVNRWFAELLKC